MSRANLAFLSGGVTGHFRTTALSGLTTTIAAGATVFSARFAPAAPNIYMRALLIKFSIRAQIVASFSAAQELAYSAFVARNWSAADTGGTALTLTAPNAMLNSISDIAPQMAIQVAGTGAMTPGTRTVDSNPFIYCAGAQVTTGAALTSAVATLAEDYVVGSDQEYPFNMQGNATPFQALGNGYGPEGLIVTNNILMGTGGTVRLAFEMEWIEYNAGGAPGGVAN